MKREELEMGSRIGVGSFGEVRDGTWKGNKVAIKLLVRQVFYYYLKYNLNFIYLFSQSVPAAARIELYAESALLR